MGQFQTGKRFLNTHVSHPANSPACSITLALFQGAEGGMANAWLHHSVMELASAHVCFWTSWPGEQVCKQPWSSDCVWACEWDLAKRLCVCLYLWKTSQWAFRGIWRLGKWMLWVIHTLNALSYSHTFLWGVFITSSRLRTDLHQGFWLLCCKVALQHARAFWSFFYREKSRVKELGILFYLLIYLEKRAEVRKYNIKNWS